MSALIEKLFVYLQRLIPRHLLTNMVYRLARIRSVPVKNFLIRRFIAIYNVDTREVKLSIPFEFESFNSFFIRELNVAARPIDAAADTIVSPVDGTVSAACRIENDKLHQAKGIYYSLQDLLATDTHNASLYTDGTIATIYLAPYNYHRVHAPLDGQLESAIYVPGDLFSVNRATVTLLPGIFVRNERLICHLQTAAGPMVLIFVGAMNVGSISTRWSGEIRPRRSGNIEQIALPAAPVERKFRKGELLGWFNMGSTVILLHPPNATMGLEFMETGQIVKVGEAVGRIVTAE